MSLRLPTLLCISLAFEAAAHELQDAARGFEVRIENLAGGMGVNGIPLTVSRATGAGVHDMAARLVKQWQSESGPGSVRIYSCCGWQVASRIQTGESRVIQWRGTAAAGELLWSSIALNAPPALPPTASAPMPGDCDWSAPVHGQVADREYLQVSARCELTAAAAIELMSRHLAREGWQWTQRSSLMLQARRDESQVEVIAAPTLGASRQRGAGTSLVLVESRPSRRRFR